MRTMYGSLFRRVLFPFYETGLRRRKTLAYLDEYERDQWRSPDEILALQWTRLSRLVAHCWDEVPYYRERWREAGVAGPGDIGSLADYARLPLLTKQDIRDNFERLKATSLRDQLLYKTTGGSTGEPLQIGYTRDNYERRNAVMHRGYAWAGASLGRRALHLWGERPDEQPVKLKLLHAAFNRRVMNVFTMKDDNMVEYADAIDTFRPDVMVSYVASVVRLARWLLANGRKVHVPHAILCAAEPLYEHERALIQAAFGCPAYNTYGCREVMLIASECEMRDGLHVNADHLCVELGGPLPGAADDAPREVILTDLHNYGMPLMRYVNGDLATAKSGNCSCGRGLPMLASVDGRSMDALRTSQGHFIGEYLEYLVFNIPGIKRFQAVQHRIDRLDVTLVRGADFQDSVLDVLRHGMREAFGDCIALDFHFADDIALTPTGKLRVAISKLALGLWIPLTQALHGALELGVEQVAVFV